jgi:lipid-A-disaccharide synthase
MSDGGAPPAPFIFLIAGEPSGDALGAALIAALREQTHGRLRVAGIGGELMQAAGLDSLVPLTDLAVGGLLEVVPRIPRIFGHIHATAAAIGRLKPDAVVTIDSSGFTWRVAERVRRRNPTSRLIHYVAPMVWAWRPRRARELARWCDHLLTLLPFEPPYFEREGLAASFVGHPVLNSGADRGDAARFRAAHQNADAELVLTALPGSRAGEVRRLLPVFGETLRRLEAEVGPFRVAVPTVATVAEIVAQGVADWPGDPIVVHAAAAKYDAFAASRAALAASGTVALELALAGAPMAIAYRLNPLTEMLLDRVLQVRQVNLVNLLVGRPVVLEHLRGDCVAPRLAASLVRLIRDEEVRRVHRWAYSAAVERLRAPGGLSPSAAAAAQILAVLAA